jgi:hypothetical protein
MNLAGGLVESNCGRIASFVSLLQNSLLPHTSGLGLHKKKYQLGHIWLRFLGIFLSTGFILRRDG